eukprot:9223197-Pyramimonas_sp.AAC.1
MRTPCDTSWTVLNYSGSPRPSWIIMKLPGPRRSPEAPLVEVRVGVGVRGEGGGVGVGVGNCEDVSGDLANAYKTARMSQAMWPILLRNVRISEAIWPIKECEDVSGDLAS